MAFTLANLKSKSVCFGDFGSNRTWDFEDNPGNDVVYAKFIVQTDKPSIEEAIDKKYKAFLKAFKTAKLKIEEHNIWDFFPRSFLEKEYFYAQNLIVDQICCAALPKDYGLLLRLQTLVNKIQKQPIRVGSDICFVKYKLFSTKTGRLTTAANSFPILTLRKKERVNIKPSNDCFVEFDYNAMDHRVFLGLSSQPQPEQDLHAANAHLLGVTRKEAKLKALKWLYSKVPSQEPISYDRESVLAKYYDFSAQIATTVYGKEINVEPDKALPIIVQSTSAYLFYEKVCELYDFILKNNLKTTISFLIHDSVVLDVPKAELSWLSRFENLLKKTRFGVFLVNTKKGLNFGQMKPIQCQ